MAENKVVKYRRPFHLNIGIIIFGITLIYLLINMFLFMTREKVEFYEVVEGQPSVSNKIYTGLALRSETVSYAKTGGYVNYYVREGSRVSLSTTLYTIDKSGTLSDLLKANSQKSQLSDIELNSINTNIQNFSARFSEMNYDEVYDFKNNIDSTILELLNESSLDQVNQAVKDSGSTGDFKPYQASHTGVVIYCVDNYEDKKADEIKASDFDQNNYKKASFSSNMKVEKDSAIYKTVTSEKWTMMIPMTEGEKEQYTNETGNVYTSVNVKFVKDNVSTTASFEIIEKDGQYYGKLRFSDYMSRYASERYVDIQMWVDKNVGLKVPKTAVLTRTTLMIPMEYGTKKGDEITFNVQGTDEDGNTIATVIKPTIYEKWDASKDKSEAQGEDGGELETETAAEEETGQADGTDAKEDTSEIYYLVDLRQIPRDSVLIKSDSQESYVASQTKDIFGVYNINSGYTVFKRVEKLMESGDYYIVDPNTEYGLVIYDHIVLNAANSSITENQVVFQ